MATRSRVPLEGLAGEGPASDLNGCWWDPVSFEQLARGHPQFRARGTSQHGSLLQQMSKGEGQNQQDGKHNHRRDTLSYSVH